MEQFFKNNWLKILTGLVFVCLLVFIFYLLKQNDENRKFIDYQKKYIENLNQKPEVKNLEVISQPVMNQPVAKDNTVEIEKCRASSKNLTQAQLDNIVYIITEFNKTGNGSQENSDKIFNDMKKQYLESNYLDCLNNIK